jgi:hypothetical protein
MKRITAAIVAALAASIVPVAANAAPTAAETAAASEAERRGAQMYAYDQAAWHGTDRFRADIEAAGGQRAIEGRGLAGYIVEPFGENLRMIFYGIKDGRTLAVARYTVSGSAVIEGGILSPGAGAEMTPPSLRMIAAREKAIEAMNAPDHGLCSQSPPNTVILPPGTDGVISAYVMTSTTDNGSYPAGGHYRFDFDPSGKLVSERRFMKTCFPLNFGAARKESKVAAVFLTHLLDPQPTEVHAFVSRNIPVALMVGTVSNKAVWAVESGLIRYVQQMPER